jgi:starch phosphorylase
VKIKTAKNQIVFEAPVFLCGLDPLAVRAELYADPLDGKDPVRQEMSADRQPAQKGETLYRARVPADRPAADYTVRLIPRHDRVSVPLEAPRILWQR